MSIWIGNSLIEWLIRLSIRLVFYLLLLLLPINDLTLLLFLIDVFIELIDILNEVNLDAFLLTWQ